VARTGAQLLTALSEFVNDSFDSTTTSAGAADGTTLTDTTLRRFGEDGLQGWYLRPTGAANPFAVRRITRFAAATGIATVAPPFAAQTSTAQTYELHRYDPELKFEAIDAARFNVFPEICKVVYNDTLTGDGRSTEFDIPSAVIRGPGFAFEERALSAQANWNFVQNPIGDSTTGWTASNLTAATQSRNSRDLIVPKYDSTATKLTVAASTNGTYTQPVADQTNGVTAALAAGRHMTFAVWIYTRTGTKWALTLRDDAGTSTSSQHGGQGWELLSVTREIAPTNATTLTIGFDADNDSTATVAFWNRGWFYYGDASFVRDRYDDHVGYVVRRDDTTQRLVFDVAPTRGRQLRLIGRDYLSALGTTVSSQPTNTMEVDEATGVSLVGEAARLLIERAHFESSEAREIARKFAIVDAESARTPLPAHTVPGRRGARGFWRDGGF
jgi:hypothetical protein